MKRNLSTGRSLYAPIPRIPTGSPMFDAALGGGIPRGRITCIVGDESSGKSTISMIIAGSVIRAGGRVGVVDVEGTTDLAWAFKMGVTDISRLWIEQPLTGEDALNIASEMMDTVNYDEETGDVLDTPYFDLIILDSTGAMVSKNQTEQAAEDSTVAEMARKLTPFFLTMSTKTLETGTALFVINHKQTKIPAPKFGDDWYPSGGRKLRHLKSVDIELWTEQRLDRPDGSIAAHVFRGKIRKNKTAQPRQEFSMRVNVGDDGYGVDFISELAGWGADEKGRTGAFPGLLKKFNLLQNKEGALYAAGYMYFNGEPVEFPVSGKMQHAKSKAELVLALKKNPAFRKAAINALYQAIEDANSLEAIRAVIEQQASPWLDMNSDLQQEDPDATLRAALEEMSPEEREDALATYASHLASEGFLDDAVDDIKEYEEGVE